MRLFFLKDRLAILGIAGILAPALLLGGLAGFSAQVDAQAQAREQHIVAHGLSTQLAEVARSAIGPSIWDEAAAHLQDLKNPTNLDWARANIRDFFVQSSGFAFVGVVSPQDEVALAAFRGREAGPEVEAFSREIAPLVAKLRAREPKLRPLADRIREGVILAEPVQEHDLVTQAGVTYAVTATLVQPDRTANLLTGRGPIVVLAEAINPAFLNRLRDQFLLSDLTALPPGVVAPAHQAQARFDDADGEHVLTLAWTPQTPGRRLFNSAAPFLGLAFALIAGLAFFFHRRASRAIEKLVDSEKRASHLAYHDPLTGLPNRALAMRTLAQALDQVRRGDKTIAVHCIDLDRFKDVNDTFGHQVGDELIRDVASILQSACRTSDTVVRLGGDEFAVIQDDCTPAKAADLAERLVALLAQPLQLSVGRIYFGGSIGICMVTRDTVRDPQECLREADLALYRAKESGRGRFAFFEPEMDAAIRNRRLLQNDLRDALRRDELNLVYQPQVDASDRVTGVEGLMRWVHPTRGHVSPGIFIPLAEECGLIEQIGWFAMRRAFADGARWPDLKVAINVSASQLRLKSFVQQVEALVMETGVDPTRFELEITEGLLLADTPETHTVLESLGKLGFSIALDDFGTGYSSLSYLKRYPISRIKIDRSFISTLGVDAESDDVVSAIVRLAHALHMAVVAEGVETQDQRARLANAGCGDIQGYLTSRPLPVDEVDAFIARSQGFDVKAA